MELFKNKLVPFQTIKDTLILIFSHKKDVNIVCRTYNEGISREFDTQFEEGRNWGKIVETLRYKLNLYRRAEDDLDCVILREKTLITNEVASLVESKISNPKGNAVKLIIAWSILKPSNDNVKEIQFVFYIYVKKINFIQSALGLKVK
jgi:hypothetical protein